MRNVEAADKYGVAIIFKYINCLFISNLYFILSNIPLVITIILFQGQWSYEYMLLLLLAVIPLGPSSIALMKVINTLLQKEELSITKEYISAYKKHFKTSMVVWLLDILLVIVFSVNIIFWSGNAISILFIVATVILISMNMYIFPFIIQKEQSLKVIFALAFVNSLKKINITITNLVIIITSAILLIRIPLVSIYFIFSLAAMGIMFFSKMVNTKI